MHSVLGEEGFGSVSVDRFGFEDLAPVEFELVVFVVRGMGNRAIGPNDGNVYGLAAERGEKFSKSGCLCASAAFRFVAFRVVVAMFF